MILFANPNPAIPNSSQQQGRTNTTASSQRLDPTNEKGQPNGQNVAANISPIVAEIRAATSHARMRIRAPSNG